MKNFITLALISFVILGSLFLSRQDWFPFQAKSAENTTTSLVDQKVNKELYSAVYLTNNQTYFGRISSEQSEYLILEDVYYFRERANSNTAKVTLIKLGNELHGPEDKIFFSRGQIVYTEQLRSDSEVVKAIDKYKAGKWK